MRATTPRAVRILARAVLLILAQFQLGAIVSRADGQLLPSHRDVVYATVDGSPLALDVYLPAGVERPPLLVWVHGGAWQSGSKESVPPAFVENGFAVASVNYRLSTQARFPAAAHDIKAAVRFLRANANRFGYSAGRVAIAGESAGGHLAALVGVSNGVEELEGEVGDHAAQLSDIQALLVYFGASDLRTILAQSTPHGLSVRVPALELFLGAQPGQVPGLAWLASPVAHVNAGDPPLLMFHGDLDVQMPINQSHQLMGAYRSRGLDGELRVVHGAAHGGDEFYSPEHLSAALDFLRRTLGGA
jgi:acetyl esterase/lipase